MRAGELRDLIAIEAHNGTSTRSGTPDPNGWHEYAQAWIAFDSQTGATVATGALETSAITSTIRGRYGDLKGVTPAMRLRWVDQNRVRLFAIESAVNVGELRDEMRLVVREVSPAHDNPALVTLPVALGVE